MNTFEIAEWVDTAAAALADGREPDLQDLTIMDRLDIIARIEEKSAELKVFAEGKKGILSRPEDYIREYKEKIKALLELAMRIDPGITEALAEIIVAGEAEWEVE